MIPQVMKDESVFRADSSLSCLLLMPKSMLFSVVVFFPGFIFCQNGLGFSSGLSVDLNNQGRFRQVPFSLTWIPKQSKKILFIMKADVALPLISKSYDSAYTTSSGLPPAVSVQKNITNHWYSLSLGWRILFKGRSENKQFFIDLCPLGVGQQKFRVVYKKYDNSDYEIINPDVGLDRTGLVASLGAGYNLKNLFLQIQAQTPPLATGKRYRLSYKLNAPLLLAAGYFFALHKSRKQ
jgi:hypothetical protein